MSDVSARVLTAVQEASQLLSKQLMRHGVCEILVQDVMRSASAWLPDAGTAALRELLVPTKHVIGNRLDKQQQIPGLHQLTDSQLDAAFGTLRMLNRRLAALSCMAHEPSSCSSTPCISVNAQSWLVAHKAVQLRHYWQYGYSLTFQNTAEEPLQLVRKAWTVQDLTGCSRHRESQGLLGLQPIIEPSGSLSCKTAITLSSIKGSMQGHFELRGLKSGHIIKAMVPAFALTPTALQLNYPQIACELLAASPTANSAQ